MKKQDIRRKISAQKTLLDEAEKQLAAAKLFEKLEQTAAFMLADKILMYHSLPDEVQTQTFLEKWNSRKKFFLPRVNGVNLDILPYDKSRLRLGAFQIEEPDGEEIHDVEEMEVIIVPGVAYDKKGNRLGRGKGFYDRLLAQSRAVKIGIAYDFQIVDEIETEPHDVPVNIIVTECRCLNIK